MANTTAFETARYYVELQWLERFHDWRRADRWMADHYEVPAALCLGYLVVIFVLQRAMRERKPFDLSGPLFWWNFLLAAFSILGAIATVPYIALEVLHGAGASADMCLYYTEVPSCPPLHLFIIFCLSLSGLSLSGVSNSSPVEFGGTRHGRPSDPTPQTSSTHNC
jgi:hypothetical protein